MDFKILLISLFISLVATQVPQQPQPQPQPQPVAQTTAKLQPQPVAQTTAKPQPQPVVQTTAKLQSPPVVQTTAKPQPQPQPVVQTTATPQQQPQPQPQPQPVAQPTAPSPPENVLFQFTSQDSFVLSWVTPPGQVDHYLLHYFPDATNTQNMVEVEINKTETHYGAVDPLLKITQLGVNLYSVIGQTKSAPAGITVLNEDDPRLPPPVSSATMQWVDDKTVQLMWTQPQGVYDSFLLLYASNKPDATARSVMLDKSRASYKMVGMTKTFNYTIHLYTVRNGIHSAPPEFHLLPQSAHACKTNPCQHKGQCIENHADPSMFVCQCELGHTGTLCEKDIKEAGTKKCTPNPCKNGGQCMENANGRACTCAMGFVGELCESAGVAVHASAVLIGLLSLICWMII